MFGDYLDGAQSCIVLVLSERTLGKAARDAIGKTLDSFGYGADSCTYATLLPADGDVEGGDIPLDAQALFVLVEGLDPVCVICADEAAASRLGQAYRVAYETDAAARVFGRPAVMFRDFTAMLSTEKGKQRAWRVLKSLPKRA